jgi:hypothetical protein
MDRCARARMTELHDIPAIHRTAAIEKRSGAASVEVENARIAGNAAVDDQVR